MTGTDSRRSFDQLPDVLTVKETSEALGMCENSLRELIRRGTLPGVTRLGRRILISKRALRRLLEGEGDPK